MSHLSSENVYRGFWIDRTKGDILGANITIDSSAANVVVAVLSVLIKFAGTNLWQIIALIAFGASANVMKRNGLDHQQQILLRNVTSPSTMLYQTLKLHWIWRPHTQSKRSFARLDILAFLATLCSAGFIIAGVLASQIVSSTDIVVLANSASCGFTAQYTANSAEATYIYTAGQQSVQYAHDCYNGSRSDPGCQIYTTQSIPFNTSYVICPFDGFCTLAKDQALDMDTGLLWSNGVFGINMHDSNALAMRQVTQCAPLNLSRYEITAPMDEKHSQVQWGRDPFPSEVMTTINVGGPFDATDNATMVFSSYTRGSSKTYTMNVAPFFDAPLEHFEQSPWFLGRGFEPISPFRKTDGNLALIVLGTNQHVYLQPVDDPFYAAHSPKTMLANDHVTHMNISVYEADNSLSVIGCTQQYQFCKSETDCTRLTHAAAAVSQAARLELNPLQNVTLYAFANAVINFGVGYTNLLAGPAPPYLAFDGRTNSITETLPPNQWELEVKYWTAIILAMTQKLMADVAIGQTIAEQHPTNKLPPGPHEHVLCHSQKMKAPNGISNINVFGLGLTVGISGALILINLTLLKMMRWFASCGGDQRTAIEQWDQEEILQVQKKAFGSNEAKTWRNSIYQISTLPKQEEYGGIESTQSSSSTTSMMSEKFPAAVIR